MITKLSLKSLSNVLFILILPFNTLLAEDGNFGPFMRSLNNKDYGYRISKDITGKAPQDVIEVFEVKQGDCSKNSTWNDCENDRERSELSEKRKATFENSEYWYGWHIYIPYDFVNIYPAKTCLGQFHQVKAHPVWMFQNHSGGYNLENHISYKVKSYPLIDEKDLKGKWHRIEVHVLWSTNNNGLFDVWVNGSKKVSYRGKTMDAEIVYFKYGIYRSFVSRFKKRFGKAEVPTQKIYYSAVKRGFKREDLKP